MEQPLESASTSTDLQPDRSPRTHVDSAPLPTDSMVTVSLSEPDQSESQVTMVTDTLNGLEEKITGSEADSESNTQLREQSNSSVPRVVTEEDEDVDDDSVRSLKSSIGPEADVQVDWATLDQKESEETRDERSDEVHESFKIAQEILLIGKW